MKTKIDPAYSRVEPFTALAIAILCNAINEIKAHHHSIPARRFNRSYYGPERNPLPELRGFVTEPYGAELLASLANLENCFGEYRRKARPLLEEAEALAGITPSSKPVFTYLPNRHSIHCRQFDSEFAFYNLVVSQLRSKPTPKPRITRPKWNPAQYDFLATLFPSSPAPTTEDHSAYDVFQFFNECISYSSINNDKEEEYNNLKSSVDIILFEQSDFLTKLFPILSMEVSL